MSSHQAANGTLSATSPMKDGEIVVLGILTILLLLPFIDKAFHIDATMFLWSAAHIVDNPADFYGFDVNWYGIPTPMSQTNQNPPLVSYFIAFWGQVFGWSEPILHVGFMLPAFAVVAGTYQLAARFCPTPLLAGLAVMVTPAFLVASSNIMSDVLMLAFYVWGAALWFAGLEKDKYVYYIGSAVCITLSVAAKYFGITMIPLLVVYTLMTARNRASRLLFLLLPVVALYGYQLYTVSRYGEGVFSSAFKYAVKWSPAGGATAVKDLFSDMLVGLSFVGGCILLPLFLGPLLWRWRFVASVVAGLVLVVVLLLALGDLNGVSFRIGSAEEVLYLLQAALFVVAGVVVFAMLIRDVRRNRDGSSAFLACWILGTFLFTTLLNWTTNNRTVLPMLPAVAILVCRGISTAQGTSVGKLTSDRLALWSMLPSAAIALVVTAADTAWANSQRHAARVIMDEFSSRRVWFQGHWGFQYYMERRGARPVDFRKFGGGVGDVLVVPGNNSNIRPVSSDVEPSLVLSFPLSVPVTTMSPRPFGRGLYSDQWGPVPYTFSAPREENYYVYVIGGR